MIDLYFWPTPNGHKITLFLEEAGVDYRFHPINISAGDQFSPDFLKISPNNRIPAIVDHDPQDGGEPISIFESGAILLYLAEKTGLFLSHDLRLRQATLEWLFWQVGGLGPMAGQNHHFNIYAPTKIPYAMERYINETNRLYGVINNRLKDHSFLAGENYSIADMACYPWVTYWYVQHQDIREFPHLARWLCAIEQRPATQRAYEKGNNVSSQPAVTEKGKSVLFGQKAR
ncbi:thiol:disulfide oxidoreductase [Saccharibacter sp. 17.LH.SD]|uniref:glutathione binding-like protein n=1 Tax=Saccharibacter sp. 17.LH.SD TaxID=2689393 RepID=UPI00136EADED|nr:glutathione binding-like protein [Saccharibacter sp. 17.LH.SD]MXV44911.1 thiol:disulfide oxidoreductase [Saccharibacter sp. 17.LH.SD]